MKKIYTISLALLMAGTVVAQKTMVKKGRVLEEGTLTVTKKGDKGATLDNNQVKGVTATLNETFELAVPATGWAATNWASSTTSAADETAATGHVGHFAFFDAFNLAAGDQGTLVTPQLQPVTGNNTLAYKVNLYKMSTNAAWQGAGAELYIEFSTDQGVSWTTSTTNVLATLTNYNTLNTGWIAKTVSLAAYNNLTVMVRFRAVSDWGWCDIGIDNVTGPNVLLFTNDISATKVFASMNGFDYFVAIPNSQLGAVYYGAEVKNNGSAAQTNVTVTADINAGAFTGATGLNNPTPSFAAGATDTLYATTFPIGSGFTQFAAQVLATQTEVDEFPANNMADSVTFYGTDASYYRTVNITNVISSYSFGTSAPAVTGFEYGATYYMQNAGRVDSITSILYRKSAGSANVVGKLYSIDGTTGAYTLVAQTAAFTPATGTNSSLSFTTLALTAPYTATAGEILAATIQINGTNFTTAPGDTISLGYDNAYIGSTSVACTAYLNVGGSMGWYTFAGVPNVGIELQNSTVSVSNVNFNNTISVFPNPAKDVVNIKNAGKDAVITISNSLGQVVYTAVATDKATIDTKNLSEGIYFVRVNNQVSKVVITK